MAGAIALAGMAALRSGAGLVTLAVPQETQATVAGLEPSYMTFALPCSHDSAIAPHAYEALSPLVANASCLAVGPGLGRSPEAMRLALSAWTKFAGPAVFDADALFALSSAPHEWMRAAGPRILTPHAGEFRRLVGAANLPENELEAAATDLALRAKCIVLLKGPATLVTDGQRSVRNTTGNPGMATGGAGDVLTGVITALVCQSLAPFDAARLGAYLHGLAGDLAALDLGQVGLIASDLVRYLPKAFKSIEA